MTESFAYLAVAITSSSSPWDSARWLASPPLPMGTSNMLSVKMMVPVTTLPSQFCSLASTSNMAEFTLPHRTAQIGTQCKPLMACALSGRTAAAKRVHCRCVIEIVILLHGLGRVPNKCHFSCYRQSIVRFHRHARVKAVVHASEQTIPVGTTSHQQVLLRIWTAASIWCDRSHASACPDNRKLSCGPYFMRSAHTYAEKHASLMVEHEG